MDPTQMDPIPPMKTKKEGKVPAAAAAGILIVALIAVFFVFLKPMLFPADAPADTASGTVDTGVAAPTDPGAPAQPSGVPAPNPAAAPPPAAPEGTVEPSTPTPAAVTPLTPSTGEIVVKGAVTTLTTGGKGFVMQVTSVDLPGKGQITLEPAREKTVSLSASTNISKSGAPSTAASIKVGDVVTALGKNFGEGAKLTAVEIQH